MIRPWGADEANHLRAMARQCFAHAGFGRCRTDVERENCSSCVLNGWGDVDCQAETGEPLQPNYGGWARTYVQAGYPIPARYAEGFLTSHIRGPAPYAEALVRDIVTFGVQIEEDR